MDVYNPLYRWGTYSSQFDQKSSILVVVIYNNELNKKSNLDEINKAVVDLSSFW